MNRAPGQPHKDKQESRKGSIHYGPGIAALSGSMGWGCGMGGGVLEPLVCWWSRCCFALADPPQNQQALTRGPQETLALARAPQNCRESQIHPQSEHPHLHRQPRSEVAFLTTERRGKGEEVRESLLEAGRAGGREGEANSIEQLRRGPQLCADQSRQLQWSCDEKGGETER